MSNEFQDGPQKARIEEAIRDCKCRVRARELRKETENEQETNDTQVVTKLLNIYDSFGGKDVAN